MTDQSDAFIEGATITAKEPAAGRSRRDTSDSNGTYVLPLLPVGTYSLSCTHPGFTTQTQANINITVNQKATVDFVDSLDGEALRSELHGGTLFQQPARKSNREGGFKLWRTKLSHRVGFCFCFSR